MQTWKLKRPNAQRPARRSHTRRTRLFAAALVVATLAIGAYDFPFVWNRTASFAEAKTGWAAPRLEEQPYRLGLDLQGGTHLVYEADMSDIPEADRLEALEGVRDVIERRVNAFGVSEPVVQTTSTGGTYRVIVELAGVLDVKEAIDQIGETPVLEFKEPGQELGRDATPEELAQLETAQAADRATAEDLLARARRGEALEWQRLDGLALGSNLYAPMVQAIVDTVTQPGRVVPVVVESSEGLIVEKYILQEENVDMLLSHILVCWEGTTGCTSDMPQLDASIKIGTVKEQATPENFAALATQYSSDTSGDGTGDLGWVAPGDLVVPFELAARALAVGTISEVVETEYGYHLIYKRDERPVTTYTVDRVVVPLTQITDIVSDLSPWQNTELSGKHLKRSSVQFDPQTNEPLVAIEFNADGSDLFGQLTERLVGLPMAIFLDGELISAPNVNQPIYGGQAIITGNFTLDEAKLLSQRLNAGALPVPVHLLSQQTVGPTLGTASLQMSVRAAFIGFALVAGYMIAYYRMAGLFSVVSLVLYAFLNLAVYRLFDVTITLAGIAGFILSLGMAVDANVLIIERMKEEIAAGRDFGSALREGFTRAWPAIRDGNAATLVAALVLYVFSTSFVRGFALMLGIGVVVSVFTAISATRAYMEAAFPRRALRTPWLSGLPKRND